MRAFSLIGLRRGDWLALGLLVLALLALGACHTPRYGPYPPDRPQRPDARHRPAPVPDPPPPPPTDWPPHR